MKNLTKSLKSLINRRSFLKNGLTAAGTATVGAELLTRSSSLLAQEGPEERGGNLTPGDAAMLRFAAAAEILETDFWVQYNELGGIQDSEVPGGSGIPAYTVPYKCLTAICRSTFTTTPMMSSHTKTFSTRIWFPREPIQ